MGRDQRCAMNNFLFENGTKFLFGGDCVREYLASFLAGYGPSVLLVTEEEGRRSDAADEARDILRRNGKATAECTVGPFCPRYEQVQRAARLCRERHVDLILGVGGSAVLDGCKAASLAAVCRGDLWENFGGIAGSGGRAAPAGGLCGLPLGGPGLSTARRGWSTKISVSGGTILPVTRNLLCWTRAIPANCLVNCLLPRDSPHWPAHWNNI